MSDIERFLSDNNPSPQPPPQPQEKPSGAVNGFMADAPTQDKGVLGHARDTALSLAQGVVGVPEAAVGLADIPTGGQVGKFLENEDGMIGFRPKQAREYLGSLKTEASQEQMQQFQDADGIVDKAAVAIQNPSLITNTVAESAPLMVGGAGAGRAVLSAAPKIGQVVAGAIGEGIVGAGSQAEQVRQETEDGTLSAKQAALATASGIGTAAFGALGGRLAQRLGIGDVDTILTAGGPSAVTATVRQGAKSLPREVMEGALSEGLLEELPQSLQEQLLQNLALDKPWTEGLSDAAVMGVLTGGVMGGAAAPFHRTTDTQQPGDKSATDTQTTAADIIPPAEPQRGAFPALPAPVYEVGTDGLVRTTDQRNAEIQAQRQVEADRVDRSRRGEVVDVTPVPAAPTRSEQMGLDPNAGPMSGAAALAVDSGATDQLAQQSALQQAAEQAQKGVSKKAEAAPQQSLFDPAAEAVDPETGEIISQGPAADPIVVMQDRLNYITQQAKHSGWNAEMLQERNNLKSELDRIQPPPSSVQEGIQQAQANRQSAQVQDGTLTNEGTKTQAESALAVAQNLATPAQQPATPAAPPTAAEIKAITAKQIPQMADAELQIAASHYGPAHKRTAKLQKEMQRRGVQPAPAAETPAQGAQAPAQNAVDHGARWTAMTPQQRQAVADQTDIKPVLRRNVSGADWNKLAPNVQQKLVAAMPGTAAAPVDAAAHEAATSPQNNLPEPTQSQKEAGNYKKGHVSVQGLDITVENPRGSTRSGAREDGSTWTHEMSDHYGYIKRTVGADSEQVDVYVGPQPDAEHVYVVDQIDQKTGQFDEHKAMIGFPDHASAEAAYRSNFDPGWKVGPVHPMSMNKFKSWLKEGDTTKPASQNQEQPSAAPVAESRAGAQEAPVGGVANVQDGAGPDTSSENRATDRRSVSRGTPDRRMTTPDDAELHDFRIGPAVDAELEEWQIQKAAPKAKRDSTTGWFDLQGNTPMRDRMIAAAQDMIDKHGGTARLVSMDLMNLGGLNAFRNNVADVANADYRAITNIVQEEIIGISQDALFMRTGGDELAAIVPDVTQEQIDGAMGKAWDRIENYAKEQGFASIKHAKGKLTNGVNIYHGSAIIKPGMTPELVAKEADEFMDASKKLHENAAKGVAENVTRSEIEQAGTGTSDRETGVRNQSSDAQAGRADTSAKQSGRGSLPSEETAGQPSEVVAKGSISESLITVSEDELQSVKTKLARLNSQLKNEKFPSLKEKVAAAEKAKQLQNRLNKMRSNIFTVEDAIRGSLKNGNTQLFTDQLKELFPKAYQAVNESLTVQDKPQKSGRGVVINRLGADGLTDQERTAGQKPYTDDAPEKTATASNSEAPGTRHNTQADREAADRLEGVLNGFNAGRSTPEGAARDALRSVIEELRKPKTVVSVKELLETAANRLNKNFSAQADIVYEVADQLGQQPAAKEQPSAQFSGNKLFTADKVAAAKARMKSKLGQLNSGIDPEMLVDGMMVAGAYIESGVRSFTQYSKAMIEDLGDGIKPYLLSFWEAARNYPGLNTQGMTTAEESFRLNAALVAPIVKAAKAADTVRQQAKAAGIAATADFHLWAEKSSGQAKVKVAILDSLYETLPETEIDGASALADEILQELMAAGDSVQAIGTVVGKPATRSKKTGSKGDMALTQDWGVEHIDGYGDSARETGNDTKDAFLKETRGYLNAVADKLRSFGFEPHKDGKGKEEKPVSVNEYGPAGSGDVSLTMHNAETGKNVYIHIGDTSLRGVVPVTDSGIAIMYRVGSGDKYASRAGNTWAPVDLSANDLASLVHQNAEKQAGASNARTAQSGQLPGTDQASAAENATPRGGNSQSVDAGLAADSEAAAPNRAVSASVKRSGRAGAGGVQQSWLEPSSETRDSGNVRTERSASDTVESQQADPAVSDASPKPELDTDFSLEGEDIGKGGLTKKYRDNIASIHILKAMQAEGRIATPEERKQIARYVGWGALKGVFDHQNKQWEKEHAELKDLLTDAEYKAARASTLNAHYTSPEVVTGIFNALERLGFLHGRVLEPSVGTGNFFGLMPASMRKGSQLHGVELDPLTSQIAAALYPSAKIAKTTGFQDFDIPSEYFDAAIGNPPFGNEPIVDDARSPYSGFSIHNYFFAKSIDKLRPGGLLTMVVSHSFLDAKNAGPRQWIADRANLVAAVRLPNTAFKAHAGTEVVTDIVVFQKRAQGEPAAANTSSWVKVGTQSLTNPKTGEATEHSVSQYFLNNPAHVLGTPTAAGSMYRAGEYTVEPSGILAEQLKGWTDQLPASIYHPLERTHEPESADVSVPDGIKVGSYFVDDKGAVQLRGQDVMGNRQATLWEAPNGKAAERMKGMIGLRDALRTQMRQEKSLDSTEAEIESHRRELNKLYDAFQDKYGFLNDPTNRKVFLDDTESPLLLALEFDYDRGVSKAVAEKEGIDQRPPSAVKADIFQRRVMFPPGDDIKVSNAKDALLASLNYKGRLDLDYMASLYDKAASEIVSELEDVVYNDPLNGMVMADEYLSGDVKTKLVEAESAAKDHPEYKRNVEALKKVIPADKRPSEIHAALGANFIPAEIFEQFAKEVTGSDAKATYIKATGQWIIDFKGNQNPALNSGKWGIAKMTASQIFERTMAGQGVVVTQTVKNGDGSTSTIVLEQETEAAREKQSAMRAEWQRWLWSDPERADHVANIYNEKMNRIVVRKYDGSHMTFPGMSPAMNLLDHQKNAVWRSLQSRQVLLDHVVGAGKTFEVVATIMEMRRLGIARKPIIAVPNHLTLQWRSEFSRLYPAANVLAATPEDFSKGSREKFFSKIITGDWDAVIIGHSSLKKIALPAETEQAVLEEQITEISEAIEDMKRARGDRNIVRDMENIKARLEAKMKLRLQALGTRDKVITFDELGVDAFSVDELHEFKNLFYNSTMERVPGMGNPAGSDKAFDLFVKMQWMFNTYGDKAPIIGATGTPVSNSLVEMFNMQRFLQYPTLKKEGLNVFDAWAKQFGSVESLYEVSPSGTGYRQSSRFAKFKNLPALMGQYQTFADTVTLDDLKAQELARGESFPVPKVAGGRPVNVVAKRSPQVSAFMGVPEIDIQDGKVQFGYNISNGDEFIIEPTKDGESFMVRALQNAGTPVEVTATIGQAKTEEDARLMLVEAALSPKISVDPESILGRFARLKKLNKETKGKVNALSLTGEANKAGLDYRLIDPSAPDFEGSKINLAVNNIVATHKKWAKDKGAQLVFCDLSVPLSARSGFGSKERRVYVRDNGELTMKRGTMHTVAGHEDLPFFVVKEGGKDGKSFTIYDAATGLRVHSGLPAKGIATDWAAQTVNDDAKRQRWITARHEHPEIDQDAIDEYNNEHEIDIEASESISPSDIAGMSGATAFSVYDDIKKKLIGKGIPEREIAFIHDYSTPAAKDKLFKAVNNGSVRVLLGSTPKMGAGTNVQQRLVGLHHIDAPWRPSDLEQREGRIIRRGNTLYMRDPEGFEIEIFRYATEQTYDTRRWQILEHKARGIEQLRNYDGTLNEIDDIEGEAANSADMKAAASGDPLILEETQLRNDVRKLEALQAAHADESQSLMRRAKSAERFAAEFGPKDLAQYKALLAEAEKHPVKKDEFAGTTVNGKTYTDREEAVKAIKRAMDKVFVDGLDATFMYRGIKFEMMGSSSYAELLSPTGRLDSFFPEKNTLPSPAGFLTRFANYIGRLPAHIEDVTARVSENERNAQQMRDQASKPFDQADNLDAAREAHKRVQRQLIAKGPDIPAHQKPILNAAMEQQKEALRQAGFGDALDEFAGNSGKGVSFSKSGKTAPGHITKANIADAVGMAFPDLTQHVQTLLARGDQGKRGGVIVVDSATPADIAKVFTAKTGSSMSSAKKLFSEAGSVGGFFDPKTGLTFLVGPNLDITTAPAVLLHEMTHGQDSKAINEMAMDMLKRRNAFANPELRAFLNRVAARMESVGETGNIKEGVAYIVEQAVIEGKHQGFQHADNRFLAWVDKSIGKSVGDMLRRFLKGIRQWMLSHGMPLQDVAIDEFVEYAKTGVEKAARGDVVGSLRHAILSQSEKAPTEKQFTSQFARHTDLRGRASGKSLENRESILRDGFQQSSNVNAMPAYPPPSKGFGSQFKANAGDVVYFVPKGQWRDTPNGMRIENGWKPRSYEAVVVTSENQEMTPYQMYMDARQKEESALLSQTDQTDTPAFKRWFGDSKVVDKSGAPLVVYHGTNANFSVFQNQYAGKTWEMFSDSSEYSNRFAHSRGGVVMPVYLSFQNPLDLRSLPAIRGDVRSKLIDILDDAGVEWSNSDLPYERDLYQIINMAGHKSGFADNVKKAGFDSIIMPDNYDGDYLDDGGIIATTYIALDPEQIKSAIGNTGAFDPSNPDILFSRSAVKEYTTKAVDELNKTFSIPGKLGWWHKSVGTMYNLAQRSPAFKRVFDAAQGFVDDVSHYANDAADLAPQLLPKLDTWRDIMKSPISAADNTAIAKPIFEGTLSWARDEDGKPVRISDMEAEAAAMTADEKAERLVARGKLKKGVVKLWKSLSPEQFAKMVDSRYQDQLLKPGIVWSDAELRSLFGLDDKQVGLYREFRDGTNRSLDTMGRADMIRFGGEDVKEVSERVMDAADIQDAAGVITSHLSKLAQEEPDREKQLMEMSHGIAERAAKVMELQAEGYAPLSRFGKYTVDVVENGARQYFGLFETKREANAMAERMRKEFGADSVSQGTLSDEAYKLFAGVTPETLELFGNMLNLDATGDSAQDKAFQEFLRLTKTNRSAMRRLIHRQGIAGFSEDVPRVLAQFIYSNARQTAAGLNMGEMGEAINEIPKEQGELKDAAIRLGEYVKNPQEEAQAIRGLLFAQYLGGSIASAFVNMTQPIAVSFPYLSQYGGARKAAAELGKAAKQMANRGFKYEDDLAEALKLAEEDGTVSPQEVHQLMAQASGNGSLRPGDGTRAGDAIAKAQNGLARMSVAWGKVFGAAEQVNRRVTFIAAYRMAKEKGMKDPEGFARRAVIETQFQYSKANKMQWGRGAIGGTLMTFKTYSISYLELLHRMYTQGGPEGKKAALLALAVLMVMGGAGGLPFEDDIEDAAEGLAQMLGYNISVKQKRRELLEDAFGTGIASFIEHGITGLPGSPLDVSGRLGMGNLIPGTGLLQSKADHTRDVLEIVGPVGDLAQRAVSGGAKILRGDIGSGLLEMSPAAVRNAAKGIDMAATGMYRDQKGYKVLDTNHLEAALKSIGFQPQSVAMIQESNAVNQQQKNFYNFKAAEIRGLWAQGIFEGNPSKVEDARSMVTDWNEKNPDQRMIISVPSVYRRVKEMRKSKDERIAATAPKVMRQKMREDISRLREE